jgi:cytochrome c peroxidase
MMADQLAGLDLFMGKGCASCHSGVNVGGHGYYPFGLIERPGADVLPEGDKGRFAVTDTVDDAYVFRASPLRNISLTGLLPEVSVPVLPAETATTPRPTAEILPAAH